MLRLISNTYENRKRSLLSHLATNLSEHLFTRPQKTEDLFVILEALGESGLVHDAFIQACNSIFLQKLEQSYFAKKK